MCVLYHAMNDRKVSEASIVITLIRAVVAHSSLYVRAFSPYFMWNLTGKLYTTLPCHCLAGYKDPPPPKKKEIAISRKLREGI